MTIPPISDSKPREGFVTPRGCLLGLAVGGISLLLYVIACIAPAMVFDKETWNGLQVLVLGWQGIFLGQFAWYANPFWFLSLVLAFFRRWILTCGAAVLALLIALDALSFVNTRVPLDEAFVNTMVFQSYHMGFYFWLASLAWVGLGALTVWVAARLR